MLPARGHSSAIALSLWLGACGGLQGLPPGVTRAMAEAPEGGAVRFVVTQEQIVGVAVPLGPGGLSADLRSIVSAMFPGGEETYRAREWGPLGEGYRVETVYREEAGEQFRSALLAADGAVLERSRSLPVAQVPAPVMVTAMRRGRRDVQRAEVVSGQDAEGFYRVTVLDNIGRQYLVECEADGRMIRLARLLTASAMVF